MAAEQCSGDQPVFNPRAFRAATTTGAAARRARNRETMRADILGVAAGVVSEHGVDGLTIRDLAKRLGYSPAAIYEYFASREEILTWLYFEGAGGLGHRCAAAIAALPADATALDGLRVAAHAYRADALARPALYRLVFGGLKELPPTPEQIDAEERSGAYGLLVDQCRKGVAEGTLAPRSLAVMAHVFWATVHGYVSLEITGHMTWACTVDEEILQAGRPDFDAEFATLVHGITYGMATEAGRRLLDREEAARPA
jgi:AcrR family transcriptional regulator